MFKWQSEAVMDPEGRSGGGGSPPPGGATFNDLPPDPSQDSGGEAPMSYIDEAFDQMQAEDRPDDGWMQQQQPPAAPQYPQPVQPGVSRSGQPPVQRPQQQQRPGAAPQQPPPAPALATPQPAAAPVAAALTPEEQARSAEAQRIRQDPFAYQAELIAGQEAAFVDALAKDAYAISDADMDAFLSGDSTKVSQALARVHVNAVGSVMKVVSQYMPIWVGNMLKVHQASSEREAQFWSEAPYLDKTKHHALALTAARTVRQFNPNMESGEMNRMVAAMVAAAAGVQITGAPSNPQQMHQTPQGVRTPGRVVRRTSPAFQPAGMQSISGAAPPARSDNVWSNMADIVKADDSGMFDGQL